MKSIKYLLAVALVVYLSSCGNGNSKEETPRKIEVTGSADMELVPDEIYVTFSLREYLVTGKHKMKLDEIKKTFLEKCKAAGIADSSISVAGISGSEQYNYYWWWWGRKRDPDFMNSVSYTIVVSSTDKLDQLVPTLDEKAVENFYISKTEHSKIEQLRKEVKKRALVAARDKAEYLAGSINEKVGEALLVQEIDNGMVSDQSSRIYGNSAGMYSNSTMGYKSESDQWVASPSYEKIKIRYEVKAEFRLD